MGGATSVITVIRDAFSQQAADASRWADTIDWTVRCDWLQVASSRIILHTRSNMLMRVARLAHLSDLRISIADLIGGGRNTESQTFAPGGKHPRATTVLTRPDPT